MVLLILAPVVRFKEILNSTQHHLNAVCMSSGVRIDLRNGVINCAVCVTEGTDIPVHSPAITDDSSAWLDPITYNIHQCVGCSLRYRSKERSPVLTFNTAEHPLSLMVFPPTELAIVDLYSLLRTADLPRAAFQVYKHSLSAEHFPVGDRVIREAMFALDVLGWFAAQDIVRYRTSLKVRLQLWNQSRV
jgi:hypothetical protein